MKRYWLFVAERYYPKGGMEDFIGAFDSPDVASGIAELADGAFPGSGCWHVFDSHEHRVVAHGEHKSHAGRNAFPELDKAREEEK